MSKTDTRLREMISNGTLDTVFANANFGNMSKRDVVKYTLLKCASGYKSGHTATSIVSELGLVTKKWTLTKLGKQYLFDAFYNGYSI